MRQRVFGSLLVNGVHPQHAQATVDALNPELWTVDTLREDRFERLWWEACQRTKLTRLQFQTELENDGREAQILQARDRWIDASPGSKDHVRALEERRLEDAWRAS